MVHDEINKPWTTSSMKIDDPQLFPESEDQFIKFIDYASSILSLDDDDIGGGDDEERGRAGGPGWSWIVSHVLRTCISYSNDVTSAILLSDLSKAWDEQKRMCASRKMPECVSEMKKKNR